MNPQIICEIASAHAGDVDRFCKLLESAESSGADWVKVQIFKADQLVQKNNPAFNVLKSIELSDEEWGLIFGFAENLKIKLVAEPYDLESFALVSGLGVVKALKIPAADIGDLNLLDKALKEGKQIFLAVGGATVNEIDEALKRVSLTNVSSAVLLHGFQNFPTKLEDSLISRIPWLRERFGCDIGFADHVDAEDAELARTLPAMAIAAGAVVIEKHITLDRAERGHDYYSALNPDEFSDFVRYIRRLSVAIGAPSHGHMTEAETRYRNGMKKFAVASQTISVGTPLADAALTFLRTVTPGFTRHDIQVRGSMCIASEVPAGTVIEEHHLEQQ